ncbi:MAG TPA: Fic family protein [Sulfurovum sp.]|nr:Fic family protein [Sulfurovum sp.]
MQNFSYKEKIEALLEHYRFSTRLAEALKVHRMSIQNWKEDSVSISKDNRLGIDVLFSTHCIIPNLKKAEVDHKVKLLTRESHEQFIDNIDIIMRVSKKSAFGSLEVEVDDTDEALFYKVIDGAFIEKDIDTRKFLEMNNLAFLTKQILVDTQEKRIELMDSDIIKKWHFGLMAGIRDDAGQYSSKMRIMPDTKITLTAPEDIPEELEYWVSKYKEVKSIYDIAHAHEHFELIHPFGDGNGRIGRLIMAHQFIKNGMLPPMIDGHNKALYYATLEKAQTEGNIIPLVYFLTEAIERMKEMLGIEKHFNNITLKYSNSKQRDT